MTLRKPYSFDTETKRKQIFPELKKLVNHEKKDGLHVACEIGHNNVVKLLLEKGMEANSKTKTGRNALHLAINGGQIDCVLSILEHYKEKVKDIKKESNREGFIWNKKKVEKFHNFCPEPLPESNLKKKKF